MAEMKRVRDLDIGEDERHQRLEWKIQRAGWVVLLLILLAAVAGLFGPGPLSSTTAGDRASGFWLEYDRFDRHHSPTLLRFHIGPGTGRGGQLRFWLNREYVENVQIRQIMPVPERVEATADRFVFVFNVADADTATTVGFHLEPDTFGQVQGRAGLETGPELSFSQFFFP